jgi:hypothetical protein
VATVHNAVKETIRAHLTLVHDFHAYASADTLVVAHALSQCTPVRYGRIASVSATHKATQFAGPHKIMYVPVHNSNLLTLARRSVLNQHRRGLPPWSSKFQIKPLPFLPIQYSPFSPNCPPDLQLSQPFDHPEKSQRTSIERKGPIASEFLPLVFYR